jgi:hypothetical protein
MNEDKSSVARWEPARRFDDAVSRISSVASNEQSVATESTGSTPTASWLPLGVSSVPLRFIQSSVLPLGESVAPEALRSTSIPHG